MNSLEIKMLEVLKELKEKHAAIGVKAEFEAEGTRIEELLRLKEICMKAGLRLILKIGGCESVRDMLEAKIVGVDFLVAPMVETAYALRKYLQAAAKVFSSEDLADMEILTDVETACAVSNFDAMLKIPEIGLLKGVVIERYDLMRSMGIDDETQLNAARVSGALAEICRKASSQGLSITVGGGVSNNSVPVLKKLKNLSRYETRKVCFNAPEALADKPEKGIFKALSFELFWLKNKINFNSGIEKSDMARIKVIEGRLKEQ